MANRLSRCAVWLLPMLAAVPAACSYDEEVAVCPVEVTLAYPDPEAGPYAGARVELKDAAASVFADSTDAGGVARFRVPAGIYSVTSSSVRLTTNYRYIFNGVRSLLVISPDSSNHIRLNLKMTRKRIIH
ncbi:hypothetical protein [Prevotella sp. kh1p2]|uniref:hypothetical protein n=1 Tax=Prevotella sp. kh1p2 TaxID=1761883 RepID=UPI0008CBDABD|nr:hypothetical protein [Prevotella sp. kh1p2]SES68714.1 hypothetical protein SAMN04487825_10255 [Prevotella sp. kh1p2]